MPLWRFAVKTSVNLIVITTQQRTNQSGERTVELSPPPAVFSKWLQLSKTVNVDCCGSRNIDSSDRWRSTFRSGSMISRIVWQTYKGVLDQKSVSWSIFNLALCCYVDVYITDVWRLCRYDVMWLVWLGATVLHHREAYDIPIFMIAGRYLW